MRKKNNNSKHTKLFYENQMWSNNKIGEKLLTEIIKKNVKPVDTEFLIELNILYTIRTLKNIIIKNNTHKPTRKFNVVYHYNCNKGESNSHTYMGTQNTL